MYKRGTNAALSDMYCEHCGFHMIVPRKRSQTREKSHMKTMWCCRCKTEQRFIEVREKDFVLSHVC